MLLFFVYKRAPLRGCLSLIVSTHYRAARVPAGLSFSTQFWHLYTRYSFTTQFQHFGAGCACNFFSPRHSFALSLLVFSKNRLYLFPVPFFLSRLGLKYRKYFKPCGRICQVFFFCLRQNVSQEKSDPKKFFLRFGLLRQSLFREG